MTAGLRGIISLHIISYHIYGLNNILFVHILYNYYLFCQSILHDHIILYYNKDCEDVGDHRCPARIARNPPIPVTAIGGSGTELTALASCLGFRVGN